MNLTAFIEYVPPCTPRLVGVYVLMLKDVVIYVGSTTDLDARVIAHRSRKSHRLRALRFKFDRTIWIPVEPSDLLPYEGAIARAMNPRHTRRVSPDASRDAEILERIGISKDETRAFERRIEAANRKLGKRLRQVKRRHKQWRDERVARVRAFVEAA